MMRINKFVRVFIEIVFYKYRMQFKYYFVS